MQLDVHQLQSFLHTLDVARGVLCDSPALPYKGTQTLGGVIGKEGRGEKTAAMQSLYPLRIGEVALPPANVLGVARVGQTYAESLRNENGIQVLPVYSGALHGNRIHPTALEPGGNGIQVFGEGIELPDRLIVSIRRNCHGNDKIANVYACGIRVDDGEGHAVNLLDGFGFLWHNKIY